jgi:hypothetical protein
MPYGDPQPALHVSCRACRGSNVQVEVWESSDGAFEDYHFTCTECGHNWWIDGPDS